MDHVLSVLSTMTHSSWVALHGMDLPSAVDHVLSVLSTMTHSSWVALHGMAQSFIELRKAVINVIRLISLLCLWFSLSSL